MIKLVRVNSDMNRVRMIDDRFRGSIYLTPDGDSSKITASSDFKSLIKTILSRPYDDELNEGVYHRWGNVTAKEIWAIQHHLLYK